MDIRLLRHKVSTTKLIDGVLTFQCEFWIDAPKGELPVGLTITHPNGNSDGIDGPVLLHEKGGALPITMPVKLDRATTGIYYVRLSVAGVELGEFPFTVEE